MRGDWRRSCGAGSGDTGTPTYSFGAGNPTPGSVTLSFVILAAGSSAGGLTFSGANTYTGVTTVSAGTLLVNNTTGSGTGSGNVVVDGTAKLGGTGLAGLTAGTQANNITIGDGTNAATLFGGNFSGDASGKTLNLGTGTAGSTDIISLASSNTWEFDIVGKPPAPCSCSSVSRPCSSSAVAYEKRSVDRVSHPAFRT